MNSEFADLSKLTPKLQRLGEDLDRYLRFEHDDALRHEQDWKPLLEQALPQQGVGMDQLLTEIGKILVPNGSAIPRPGCTSFITTGASNTGILATLAAMVASPQRIGLNAFSQLEEISLNWLVQLFGLSPVMKGVYSSGGSVANLIALGAARQFAYEQVGEDPSEHGLTRAGRIFTTASCHRTVHRAAAVLGLGRTSVCTIESDEAGRMNVDHLMQQIQISQESASQTSPVNVAIVAKASTTATGAIDPIAAIAEVARAHSIWLHVDGAYGLPGILDPNVAAQYHGIEHADSVIVDPHKWLGAPVGIGAAFVRDRALLHRAFTQGASDYLEGTFSDSGMEHTLDSMGIPFHDFSVELSAPARGAVVWALLREIGVEGMRARVCRHNQMARHCADLVKAHPRLELLQEPTLSICCFRYVHPEWHNLNELNRSIHHQLLLNNVNLPSTALINDQLALRPCFVGARTNWEQVEDLVREVVQVGDSLTKISVSG